MKKASIFILLILVPFIVIGEIGSIPFAPESFDIEIIKHPHMIQIKNPTSEYGTYYTYTNKERNCQLRYSFQKQTNKDDPNIRMSYALAMLMISLNLAGHEEGRFNDFEDNDVKNEFNGDFGTTVFIVDPKSDFAKGFKYMMLNFYYKNNQGIVVQSILFNDLSVVQNTNFVDLMYSFKFKD